MHRAPIAVLGAGSWGTALAIVLARNGNPTHLWDIASEQIQLMAERRVNERYLPDIILPENLQVFDELQQAVAGVRDILIAIPSHAFGEHLSTLKPLLTTNARIAWATKGLDKSSRLLHEVANEVLGSKATIAVLSGPTFAKEVAQGLPTAIALATNNKEFGTELKSRFENPVFKVFSSDDIVGVQLGGVVKNVLAIAAGISDGLGYGANTRCAILTRGLYEMAQLGVALGAKQETFMGLAGLGDLILTGTDNQSRNRRFGLAIGQGYTSDEALAKINQVVEGYYNAAQVNQMAINHGVTMPIIQKVYHILYQGLAPEQAVLDFLVSGE
jgi:glycerol-3-phosphate dehydrogenase (NAD(P)+)